MSSARRYPWQAFTSHKLRRASFTNRAHWQNITATELGALRRAVTGCTCRDCRTITDRHLGQSPLFDLEDGDLCPW